MQPFHPIMQNQQTGLTNRGKHVCARRDGTSPWEGWNPCQRGFRDCVPTGSTASQSSQSTALPLSLSRSPCQIVRTIQRQTAPGKGDRGMNVTKVPIWFRGCPPPPLSQSKNLLRVDVATNISRRRPHISTGIIKQQSLGPGESRSGEKAGARRHPARQTSSLGSQTSTWLVKPMGEARTRQGPKRETRRSVAKGTAEAFHFRLAVVVAPVTSPSTSARLPGSA